jgi:hypothetical protein
MANSKEDNLYEDFWDEDEEFLSKEEDGKEDKQEDEEEKDPPKEDTEDEVDPFDEDEDTEPKVSDDDPVQLMVKSLAEVGLLPESDEPIEVQDAIQAIIMNAEEYVQKGIEAAIESWKEDIGEVGVSFAKFVKAGGDPDEFFKMYAKEHTAYDLSSSSSQERFLRYYYQSFENLDEDEIDDRIELLQDRGRLEDQSKKLYSKLKEKQDLENRKKVEEQVKEEERRRKEQKKEQDDLILKLNKVDEYKGVKINKLEKPSLITFITRPTQELEGHMVSGLTKALDTMYRENPEALLVLAKWAKSGFDLDTLTGKKSPTPSKNEPSAAKRDFKPSPQKKSVLDYF